MTQAAGVIIVETLTTYFTLKHLVLKEIGKFRFENGQNTLRQSS